MRLSVPDVRIADVETCDFGLMPSVETEALLRAAHPTDWRRYLTSSTARRFLAELGVERRCLTQIPGQPAAPSRLNALDLARSAVRRMQLRRPADLAALDALIFVSTSNPNPCNSQAALLAGEFGFHASCLDLKAGCSGGVLGLMQAALLIQGGCERVLVVMAENLSQLTPPEDLRMLLTVGDGAACVLVERRPGPGFLSMLHGTESSLARAMEVRTPFPPATPGARYAFEMQDAPAASAFIASRWRSLYRESLAAAGIPEGQLAHWFFHQTHGAQVTSLLEDLGVAPATTVTIVDQHGNMGTPTFACAMARGFDRLQPGDRYLLQAVGGGVSWAAIVAEHS
jgi:3-oxoacyl-[acyl-carrier-protein] synthase-3